MEITKKDTQAPMSCDGDHFPEGLERSLNPNNNGSSDGDSFPDGLERWRKQRTRAMGMLSSNHPDFGKLNC